MASTRRCATSWCGAPAPNLRGVRMRPTALLALAVLALGTTGLAGTAAAAPTDVIADYFVDGQLNGTYPVDDLRGALEYAQQRVGGDAQYSAFADIISEAITRDLAGTSDSAAEQLRGQDARARPAPAAPPDPTATTEGAAGDGLPTPPPSDPADRLPAAVPVMGFVALGLVAVGSASAIWRRRRRR